MSHQDSTQISVQTPSGTVVEPADRIALLTASTPSARGWVERVSVQALSILSPELVKVLEESKNSQSEMSQNPRSTGIRGVDPSPAGSAQAAAYPVDTEENYYAQKEREQGFLPPTDINTAYQTVSPDVWAKMIHLADTLDFPSHFIRPPVAFGTQSLSQTESTELCGFRKEHKGSSSLEQSLKYLNSFSKSKPHLSERDLIKNLHCILPLSTLERLDHCKEKPNQTLKGIYLYLQTHFGKLLTPEEVYQKLSVLTSEVTATPPMEVLEKISELLIKVSDDNLEYERTAIRESLRYLKLILPTSMWPTLTMQVRGGTLSTLIQCIKSTFRPALEEGHRAILENQKKVRKLNQDDQAGAVSKVPREVTDLAAMSELLNMMRLDPSQVTCFNCSKVGHFSRDCPNRNNPASSQTLAQNQTQPAPPPRSSQPSKQFGRSRSGNNPRRDVSALRTFERLVYSSCPCAIHTQSLHSNADCRNQQTLGCTLHPGAHSLASCPRMEDMASLEGRMKKSNLPTQGWMSGPRATQPQAQTWNQTQTQPWGHAPQPFIQPPQAQIPPAALRHVAPAPGPNQDRGVFDDVRDQLIRLVGAMSQ